VNHEDQHGGVGWFKDVQSPKASKGQILGLQQAATTSNHGIGGRNFEDTSSTCSQAAGHVLKMQPA